jgi:hypothetical protein
MGKKRRLMSARAKFGNKHSSHPRMKTIMAMQSATDTIEPVIEVKEEPKVVETPVLAAKTTPEPTVAAVPELKEEPAPKPLLNKVEFESTPKLAQPATPKPPVTKVEVKKSPAVAAKATKQTTSKAKKPTTATKKASKK